MYNEEHDMFRKSFRRFLEKEAVPFFEQWEKDGIIPRAFWEKAGAQGFLCPWADEAYGGSGADFLYSAVISEEIERVGTGLMGLNLHNDIAAPYLKHYGTEAQKAKWLPACVTGKAVTAIAMTEPHTGSDLASIQTKAEKAGDHYIINGEKTFITNGIHADLIIVVCRTNPEAAAPHKGISLFVVERDTPGFKRGKKLDKVGLHSQDTAELIFEDAKVPAENMLGHENEGFYYLMKQLQQERLILAIGSIAGSRRMLELTQSYVKERKAFGQSLSSFQHVQFQLAELHTEITIGETFVNNVIARHAAGEQLTEEVSMAKWWITALAKRTADTCMQLHGGYGFIEEYEIARRYRDVPVQTIYAGSNEMMKQIIAKEMNL
ncbi:acyl-CoA dehydrogenase [Salsuginibacillus halophilus]|uniref:Acyl-CoA dehydrogenase n=1 Tax=Salsuginibacillus halophilus TaxID=517424 RepID=A0A2P8HQG0_9BACI|nr:acyl-CoA dehydrogenase family protein [Salsuginibacillus halophilus]PSL48442.1 acyl-CoA dehydrogenase [Salsuginibacillus halophilus]